MAEIPSNPRNAVVLLSGGLDSATVLAVARRDGFACHTLAFDYGQRHRHELVAAQRVAAALGARTHKVVALDLRSFGGSSLTADIAVPKDRHTHQMPSGVPSTYVPARNLIFLSLATACAEALGSSASEPNGISHTPAHDLFIGVNAIDYSGYPDCRPDFIRAFEHAANLGTRAGSEGHRFRVHTPLIHLTKAQIITLGACLGVDYALTHSCYDPVIRGSEALACARCDSCALRREGFRAAGITDPTRYA